MVLWDVELMLGWNGYGNPELDQFKQAWSSVLGCTKLWFCSLLISPFSQHLARKYRFCDLCLKEYQLHSTFSSYALNIHLQCLPFWQYSSLVSSHDLVVGLSTWPLLCQGWLDISCYRRALSEVESTLNLRVYQLDR